MTEDEFAEVIRSYPYPIASIFTRLGAPECIRPGEPRRKAILKTAEGVSRFLCALVLCHCRDHAKSKQLVLSATFSAGFYAQFQRPSWGSWMQFTREGLKWLLNEDSNDPLVQQLLKFFFKGLPKKTSPSDEAKALDRLLTVRNRITHDSSSDITHAESVEVCEKTFPDLILVLRGLKFLEKYHLDYIDGIEVHKRVHQQPNFIHTLSRICGGQGDFRGWEASSPSVILENRAVLFRHTETGTYLNLDPFLIHEQKAGAAKDLFFFNGMESPLAIKYVACKHGGGFESANSLRGDELAEEMRILLQVLAPAAEASHGE